MKCHYEVLNVPRDADDAEIKSAYRKLALKWHPDKNLDNAEIAKEQFQLVQQAYEILSDRQERAWYDNHREQILRGANSEFQDKSLDVFQYFTTTCFKGFDDGEQGFFTVYRKVFDNIAKEDLEFIEDKEEFCVIPSFGNSQTDYEKVSEFYNYWLNYSTKKSYTWLDPFDIRDLRDKKYIKLVEKENKKVRLKAKKERNEEVRNLVAFVRKRDKRVHAQKKLQEQKILEDKKKREQLSKQKRLERLEELNSSASQPDWAKFDNVESELAEIEKNLAQEFGDEATNSEDESDEEDLSNLYCVACNKIFKTPKAFQNHESSKKHKENVELLKETMLQEEDELDSQLSENVEDYIDIDDTDKPIEDILEDGDLSDDTSNSEVTETLKNKQKKKSKKVISSNAEDDYPVLDLESNQNQSNSETTFEPNKKQKKKNKKKANNNSKPDQNLPEENSEMLEISKKKETNSKNKKKDKKDKNQKVSDDIGDVDNNHNCLTCKSVFTSKNKLFDHLKKTGHGVYIPPNVKNKKNIKEK